MSNGKRPELKILEEANLDNWQERERYWIAYFREGANDLTNKGRGGEGRSVPPPQTIPEGTLTLSDAAAELGITANTLMNYVVSADGKKVRRNPTLPTHVEVINGRATHVVNREDFEAWKKQRSK